MKVPIPNDWSGQEWLCIQLQWPNSPQWLGLLMGILTIMQRGRYWDETTGSIKGVQSVAREIERRAHPFVDCEGLPIDNGDNDMIHCIIAGQEAIEGIEQMSLCGYNPDAFKIEDGRLYVRNFCGVWEEIGILANQEDLPPSDDIPPPPPDTYVDSTACSMASALAVFCYNIVVEAMSQVDGVTELIEVWDFYNDMNAAFPTIDLAFGDLMNMWASAVVLEIALLSDEVQNQEAIDYLKCAWEPLTEDRNDGITESEYASMISVSDTALQAVFPRGSWSGFGNEMRHLWTSAIKSIGPKDAQKITYYAQPTPGEDCSCPGAGEGDLPPVEGGWYLGEVRTLQFAFDDVKENSYTHQCMVPLHDVYGLFHWGEIVSISGTLARYGKEQDAGGCAHDYQLTAHAATANFQPTNMYMQMDDSPATTLYDAMGTALPKQYDTLADRSKVVVSPIMAGGLTGQVMFFAVADAGGSGVMKVQYRLVHNTGSPSHT